MRTGHFLFFVKWFLFALLFCFPAAATTDDSFALERQGGAPPKVIDKQSTKAIYLEYFKRVSRQYNVPLGLMFAIVDNESGFSPWAINIQGKGYLPKSKEEALVLLSTCQGKSFDVGLMQINVFWLRRFGIKAEDAIEPSVNIVLGAYILNENLIAYGPTWKAVAAYHTSPTKNPYRAIEYAKKVWGRYQKHLAQEEKQGRPG